MNRVAARTAVACWAALAANAAPRIDGRPASLIVALDLDPAIPPAPGISVPLTVRGD